MRLMRYACVISNVKKKNLITQKKNRIYTFPRQKRVYDLINRLYFLTYNRVS